MEDVLDVYEQFIKDVGEPVKSVAGDDFFNNKVVQTFNDELDIQVVTGVAKDDHLTPQGNKLGIIDRLTRTLKNYINKYMLENGTTKWTKFLPKITINSLRVSSRKITKSLWNSHQKIR